MMNMPTYKLSDNVIARIAQIVQEGILLGIDVVDLLRQIEVQVSDNDESYLDLTAPYMQRIVEHHKKLLAEAEALKQTSKTTILS